MKTNELNIETLQCYDRESEKTIEFTITSDFLTAMLKSWAEEDSRKGHVENPELYVIGRTDSLFDSVLNNELDEEVYSNIFETAKENNEILNVKSL